MKFCLERLVVLTELDQLDEVGNCLCVHGESSVGVSSPVKRFNVGGVELFDHVRAVSRAFSMLVNHMQTGSSIRVELGDLLAHLEALL